MKPICIVVSQEPKSACSCVGCRLVWVLLVIGYDIFSPVQASILVMKVKKPFSILHQRLLVCLHGHALALPSYKGSLLMLHCRHQDMKTHLAWKQPLSVDSTCTHSPIEQQI